MLSVVGIHGIAQQQSGRNQLLAAWDVALKDGIERAFGTPRRPPHALDLAFYGDLFLGLAADKGAGEGVGELAEDDVGFLASIEQELVDDGAIEETKGIKRVPRRLGRLTAWLDDKFGMAGRLLFIGDLVQVRRFQQDGTLRAKVLDRVRQTLATASPRVLIGHSLGSVVALEALCAIDAHGVHTLITLGSPLGLHSIQAALSPAASASRPELPPGLQRWVNIYDPTDPVACAGGLGATWHKASDATVTNGDDPHRIERYLGKKETGAAVLAAVSAP